MVASTESQLRMSAGMSRLPSSLRLIAQLMGDDYGFGLTRRATTCR